MASWIPFKSLFIAFLLLLSSQDVAAQFQSYSSQKFSADERFSIRYYSQDSTVTQEYPDPKMVFRRSLILPGWGQVTNKQVWKVPIVYGLIGGLSYYSVYLTKTYHDYRAAYYNSFEENTDQRFGATPDYLANQNASFLKSRRNFLRNRRDFIYITVGLAYLLNAVDAYVFAHLRSFDVSDDLSMNGRFTPDVIRTPLTGEVPSITLTLRF